MVLKNLLFVPYGWFKLCYTASHVDKYTEEERYQVLKMIDRRANWGGRITIDAHGVENIPEKDGFMFFPIIRAYMMCWRFLKCVPVHFL